MRFDFYQQAGLFEIGDDELSCFVTIETFIFSDLLNDLWSLVLSRPIGICIFPASGWSRSGVIPW